MARVSILAIKMDTDKYTKALAQSIIRTKEKTLQRLINNKIPNVKKDKQTGWFSVVMSSWTDDDEVIATKLTEEEALALVKLLSEESR